MNARAEITDDDLTEFIDSPEAIAFKTCMNRWAYSFFNSLSVTGREKCELWLRK